MGENNYIVSEIMNEMENKNGSYNSDIGQFANVTNHDSTRFPIDNQVNQHGTYSNKLYQIIQNDPKLVNLINNNQTNMSKLNSLLSADDQKLKRDLFDCPDVLPAFLYDYFKIHEPLWSNDNLAPQLSQNQSQNSINNGEVVVQNKSINSIDKESLEKNSNYNSEINLTKFLTGPLLAAICFFIVTNTPIFYYLGKIPYIGNMLTINKLFTSLALIILIFIGGELLINSVFNLTSDSF